MFQNNKIKYIFLIIFAFLNCYMLFNLSAMYRLDGHFKKEIPSVIIGGQTAGDYSVANMLESQKKNQAYNPKQQIGVLEGKFGYKGVTFSNSNPIRSFLIVPFLQNNLISFFNILCFISFFLFFVSIYCLFSWKISFLLSISLPVLCIAFSQGIFELFLASILLFLITNHPRNLYVKAFLGGLLSANICIFISYLIILMFNKNYKVLRYTILFFSIFFFLSIYRYDFDSFACWIQMSTKLLKSAPFLFDSFLSYFFKSSCNLFTILFFCIFSVIAIFFVSKSIINNQNANQCMKICEIILITLMLNPWLTGADFVYLGIVVLVYIYDCEERGWLYIDKVSICLYFSVIFLDGLFAKNFSMQYLMLLLFVHNCIARTK